MKFELEPNNRGASDEELLADLRRVAADLSCPSVTMAQYATAGRFSPSAVHRRFGTWNHALELAGLPVNRDTKLTDADLFDNIKTMWIELERQPRYQEVRPPLSRWWVRVYENRFGTWSESLRQFVVWVNTDERESTSTPGSSSNAAPELTAQSSSIYRRMRRDPTDRQRFRILVRDGFRCCSCGASPLESRGVELHVDHVIPWSQGGETVDDNLETKCSQCNLGKGAAFHV